MRKPKRTSPSSIAKFEKDREDFYLTYLSEKRPPRQAQSQPASVGSAFDAYVKAQLISNVTGEQTFDELFETQVEPQNRDFAKVAGAHVMSNYVKSGAYVDLVNMLESAVEEPQFEFSADTTVEGVPIGGYPDCRFVHRDGAHVVLDWKVNGYCGKGNTSPSKGYALCRDGYDWPKPSRSHMKCHDLYEPREFLGIEVNKLFMEDVSIDWADQLSMYGWMMGEPVGAENLVVCIDQIVAKNNGSRPLLRIANHRAQVSKEYQLRLVHRLKTMWKAIEDEHIFTDLTIEDSLEKCKKLDKQALSLLSDGTSDGDFYAHCARPKRYYNAR